MTTSAATRDRAPAGPSPDRGRLIATRSLTGLAIVAAIYLLFAATAIGQRFDDAAKLYAVTNHVHYRRLETLATVLAYASVALVLLAIINKPRPQRLLATVWAAVAVLPPLLLAELGKHALPRPHLHPTPRWIGGAGFPSGHAAITASCVLTMMLLVKPQWWRRAAVLATLVMMASVSLVITSGMHRPSDAYAAPVVALTWVACVATFVAPRRARWSRSSRGMLWCSGVVAVVGAAIGSAAFHSVAGGRQQLPAQSVINHATFGSVVVALAIALAVGVVAQELLVPAALPPLPHE